MIINPEITNEVLIKDILSFPDRGLYTDFVTNPLANNMFFMENPKTLNGKQLETN